MATTDWAAILPAIMLARRADPRLFAIPLQNPSLSLDVYRIESVGRPLSTAARMLTNILEEDTCRQHSLIESTHGWPIVRVEADDVVTAMALSFDLVGIGIFWKVKTAAFLGICRCSRGGGEADGGGGGRPGPRQHAPPASARPPLPVKTGSDFVSKWIPQASEAHDCIQDCEQFVHASGDGDPCRVAGCGEAPTNPVRSTRSALGQSTHQRWQAPRTR